MHIVGDPVAFARDSSDGFLAAYSRYVQRVPDTWAVMRRNRPYPGKVSLIIGGGSGHYPAFSGLVGTGMADAAVIGEVFTSPSAEQAYRTGRILDCGGGILFSYGNYAGDVLNFGVAQDRLRAAGIDCRTVLVTDDIASAPLEQASQRRGVAGDFTVFKIAGAAAERGANLNEVERIARKANARTVSFGAAFGGCTLPGADLPLFTVPPGSMELGLGIHGEPGVRTVERPNAEGLARYLVESLLAERPANDTGPIAVLLNGLGATKYDELFLLFKEVNSLLGAADLQLVQPEVGELVTSLDMAGVSLTITWLDEELAELWTAPADTPAFRRGLTGADWVAVTPVQMTAAARPEVVELHAVEPPPRGPDDYSTEAADIVKRALAAMLTAVEENQTLLGRLDSVAGDGDHGTAMVRGMRAACASSRFVPAGAQATLDAAADAFADRGAGTSGLLWGVLLHAVGDTLGNGKLARAAQIVQAVQRGTAELIRVGGARSGDKTMVDALLPFAEDLAAAVKRGEPLAAAWLAAAAVATGAAAQTAQLVAQLGRARPLGAKGLGSPDPGATSMALCLHAVGVMLTSEPSSLALT